MKLNKEILNLSESLQSPNLGNIVNNLRDNAKISVYCKPTLIYGEVGWKGIIKLDEDLIETESYSEYYEALKSAIAIANELW